MTTLFHDPVAGEQKLHTLRTSIVYHRDDFGFLNRVHGRKSTIQITTNILLRKLKHELERNNITSYDPDAYERAVAGCTLVLGSADAVPSTRHQSVVSAETADRDDGRRTGIVGRSSAPTPDLPANPGVVATRAGGRKVEKVRKARG